MSRYIDADELKRNLWAKIREEEVPKGEVGKYILEDFIEMVAHFPTADVAEVKHGRWIVRQLPMPLSDGSMECVECSVCHTHWDGGTNYCPNCGAKMERKEEENATD